MKSARLRIPRISATQSTGRLPPSPREGCHSFQAKPATWTTGRLPPPPGAVCRHRSAATLGGTLLVCIGFACQPRPLFAHGFSFQGNLVRIVYQTIEDSIGERRIPEGLMPVLDGELARDDRGTTVVAIFQQFQQISTVFIPERREPPIIEDQHVGLRQGGHQLPIAPIPLGHGPLLEEPGETEAEGCKTFAAGLLTQRARDTGF